MKKHNFKIMVIIVLLPLILVGCIVNISIICSNTTLAVTEKQKFSLIYLFYIHQKIKKTPLINPIKNTINYQYYPMDCIERYSSTVEYETRTNGREIEKFYVNYFDQINYHKYYVAGVPRFSRNPDNFFYDTFVVNIYEDSENLDLRKVVLRYGH